MGRRITIVCRTSARGYYENAERMSLYSSVSKGRSSVVELCGGVMLVWVVESRLCVVRLHMVTTSTLNTFLCIHVMVVV